MKEKIKELFLNRIKQELSEDDYKGYLSSLEKDETHGMTVNLDKLKKSTISLDYLVDRFDLKEIYKNENYAYFTYDKNALSDKGSFPGKDPLYHAGLYYIQEPSAAMVLSAVDIKKDDIVLDLCASPGGKTSQILYSLKNESGGFLVANEIDFKRMKVLRSNVERLGFRNIAITCNTSKELRNKFGDSFDKVIVDAPCSGEGMFRKSEEAREQWSPSLIESCVKLQKELVEDSYHMLKNGGLLIYSTCTFSKDEDENIVRYLLDTFIDLKLIEMKKNYPFNSIGEGQFFAIFVKGEDPIIKTNKPSKRDFDELNLIQYGVDMYEENGKVKMPSHASTHIDDIAFENVVDLDEDEIKLYLRGETLKKELGFNGFCKVTYKGLGVGVAKYAGGILKNHYPKGLRNF